MNEIKVNLDNLTEEERKQLMALVEKGNKAQSKVWKPKKGEVYWTIGGCGVLYQLIWADDRNDEDSYAFGNCFRTKEKAEFALERLKIRAELQRYADEHNEGEIDWGNYKPKYYIYYDYDNGSKGVGIDYVTTWRLPFQVYFTSSIIAQNAIKAVGEDRIKKYLFGVEE